MSTRVGTLQAPRAGGPILLAAFLASFVMLIAISLDRDQGRQGETTFVGRHMVNTPSELSPGSSAGPSRRSSAARRPTRRVS
jgi:hypothetical protein